MYYRALHDDERDSKAEIHRLMNIDGVSNGFPFEMPPLGIQPKTFVNKHFGPNSQFPLAQFDKGTTTLAFIYKPKTEQDKGGIVVAVDSRATGGTYISSKKIMKILPITDKVVATMAGGAADCQFWIRALTREANLFELRENRPMSVAALSQTLANMLYRYRNHGLSIASMIAGIDWSGPALYMVMNGGGRLEMPRICAVGSGMMNALAVVDTKYREAMTDKEALELGREAIMRATFRDAGSGGHCNVCHITTDGAKIYPPENVSEMWWNDKEKKEQEQAKASETVGMEAE